MSSWRSVLEATCDKVCQWLAVGWGFSLCTPVSSRNKTDHHDILFHPYLHLCFYPFIISFCCIIGICPKWHNQLKYSETGNTGKRFLCDLPIGNIEIWSLNTGLFNMKYTLTTNQNSKITIWGNRRKNVHSNSWHFAQILTALWCSYKDTKYFSVI